MLSDACPSKCKVRCGWEQAERGPVRGEVSDELRHSQARAHAAGAQCHGFQSSPNVTVEFTL